LLLPKPDCGRINWKAGISSFPNSPRETESGRSVGHIGIIKIEGDCQLKEVYLIHAGGTKSKGGAVRKVLLLDYISKMPFAGVIITRIEERMIEILNLNSYG
jgi:hypothetical protein